METANEAAEEMRNIISPTKGAIRLHLSAISALDTTGVWLVVREMKRLQHMGRDISIIAGTENRQSLVDVMSKACTDVGLEKMAPPADDGSLFFNLLESLGATTVGIWRDFVEILDYLGASVWRLSTAVFAPDRLRIKSIVSTLDQAGFRAMFIVALMAFLIGAIICQQSAFYLRYYGGEIFTVDLVSTLVLREIGVLITAIMVAGRSGSAITAELGSMKMREEIDALKVAGLDPVDVLVVPRLISLIIALPLLTILANASAMLGAMVVAATYSGIPVETFIQRFSEAVDLQISIIGLVKAPFMAVVIGLIACMEGMKVEGSATSLGQRTTLSVVKAIFMVIVMDGVFAMLFAAMGI